jgi:hypothetical protein
VTKRRSAADFPTGYGYDADAYTNSDTTFIRRDLKDEKSGISHIGIYVSDSDPAEDYAVESAAARSEVTGAWGPDFPDGNAVDVDARSSSDSKVTRAWGPDFPDVNAVDAGAQTTFDTTFVRRDLKDEKSVIGRTGNYIPDSDPAEDFFVDSVIARSPYFGAVSRDTAYDEGDPPGHVAASVLDKISTESGSGAYGIPQKRSK